jgi:hypothetical protein
LAYELSCDASTKVLFNCKGAVRLVPPDIGHQLIQIAREGVGNALRYAKAKSVRLKLGFTEVNRIEANLSLRTSLGTGTTIRIFGTLPGMDPSLMRRSLKLRLILADDHPVLRDGLSLILGAPPIWRWSLRLLPGRKHLICF